MKRRSFLKLLGKGAVAAAAAPIVAKAAPITLPDMIEDNAVQLAQPRAVGVATAKSRSGVITSGNFPRAIWPGVEKLYGDSYAKMDTEFYNLMANNHATKMAKSMRETREKVAAKVLHMKNGSTITFK